MLARYQRVSQIGLGETECGALRAQMPDRDLEGVAVCDGSRDPELERRGEGLDIDVPGLARSGARLLRLRRGAVDDDRTGQGQNHYVADTHGGASLQKNECYCTKPRATRSCLSRSSPDSESIDTIHQCSPSGCSISSRHASRSLLGPEG